MTDTPADQPHPGEPHHERLGDKLNWLRAGVLGANDGIVSTAGIVVGVAGASTSRLAIFTAGLAALVAGALSMAGGEYVSVSSQRDTERAMIRKEKRELKTMPEAEERELAGLYEQRGLSPELAAEVARELTKKDALAAHAEVELGIDPDAPANPWTAAFASFVSFSIGALLPLVAILLPSVSLRVGACAAAVVLALVLTGLISARLGQAGPGPAIARNVGIGVVTMAVTYVVGHLFGVATG
ncbi:VIT1/CCC1 transporter family protein [Stackebrandtia nassauensis]|uniref:VIT family protein n=1 Tax=Stackebrandtia nassauensis (strain DSM 44728 / CIP 108903 / NRRL B-16338 / NBRC 102104 / LLR-40K-21) TaxID=446470 RepID=D3QA82_STANL|nr:VIT family protein [Stackebrandtia nassauensis]ADD40794.1 protein of unknown function DUF125 transmembrane [Stackebrandtia nassauensis DSM 44728]